MITSATTIQHMASALGLVDVHRLSISKWNPVLVYPDASPLSECIISLSWGKNTARVFDGWYAVSAPVLSRFMVIDGQGATEMRTSLLRKARKRAVGPVGVFTTRTIRLNFDLIPTEFRPYVWFYNEADAVDFQMSQDDPK